MAFALPFTAVVIAGIGALALIGWILGVPQLRSVLPGAVEMKANTAFGLLACALALWQLSDVTRANFRHGHVAAQLSAFFAALLGLLTLSQYMFGWDAGIDQAIFSDTASRFNVAKGRMSPYSAVALACSGSALLVVPRSGPVALAHLGAACTCCIGGVSLIGYGWNAAEITTDVVLPPVPLNAAIALLLLGIGVMAAGLRLAAGRRKAGWVATRPLISSIEFKILVGFSGCLLLLLFGGGVSYRAGLAFADTAQSVSHSQQVLAAIGQVKADVIAVGLSQRDYLGTGHRRQLDAYRTAIATFREEVHELRELVVDSAGQLATLGDVEPLVQMMQSRVDAGPSQVRSGPRAASTMPDVDPVYLAAALLDHMHLAEDRVLRERKAAHARSRTAMLAALLITIALAAAILAALFQNIRAHMQARQRAHAELARARSTAERALHEADAANRAKSRFLAAMSHEIRTPMNSVLGLVELVRLGKLDPDQRSTLDIVWKSSHSLLRIVDDILDFSKIEAGKLELNPQPISMARLIERVCSVHRSVAGRKRLLLRAQVDPRISPVHYCDALRLEQVLNNFMSNAIKFTEQGSVELIVEQAGRAEGVEELCLRVRDTGIGIPADKIDQLFQPFTQAEADTSTRYGGTGLGLTICGRLARMMGGTATISSTPGVGTTATLTITLPVADEAALASSNSPVDTDPMLLGRREPPSIEQAEREGTLLLVVDDHPTNLMVLARQVGLLGYAVETASDGHKALELFGAKRFGAIITDCNMPEMSGYELARSIRAWEKANGAARIPILACTASALPSEAAACAEAGMDDYLVKPLQLGLLARRLDSWLGPHRVAAVPDLPAEDALIDQGLLDTITGGNVREQMKVLSEFARLNREDAKQLHRSLFQEVNLQQAALSAHRIHGSSRMLGSIALALACEAIESAGRAGDIHSARARFGEFERELQRLEAWLKERRHELGDEA